ncbi:MAG TPA: hypothetical protein PK950_03310 [Candidatus Paceibacterota bacterium]|nr:hypothetical protein [Candidatus Paceibacterota bacterium]
MDIPQMNILLEYAASHCPHISPPDWRAVVFPVAAFFCVTSTVILYIESPHYNNEVKQFSNPPKKMINGIEYTLLCNVYLDFFGGIAPVINNLIEAYGKEKWHTVVLDEAYDQHGRPMKKRFMKSIWGRKDGNNRRKKPKPKQPLKARSMNKHFIMTKQLEKTSYN